MSRHNTALDNSLTMAVKLSFICRQHSQHDPFYCCVPRHPDPDVTDTPLLSASKHHLLAPMSKTLHCSLHPNTSSHVKESPHFFLYHAKKGPNVFCVDSTLVSIVPENSQSVFCRLNKTNKSLSSVGTTKQSLSSVGTTKQTKTCLL